MESFADTWRFDTSEDLSTAPASGDLRSGPVPILGLGISGTSGTGIDRRIALLDLVIGDRVIVQEKNDATKRADFDVTGPPVDHGSWVEVLVAQIAGSGTGDPTKNSQLAVTAVYLSVDRPRAYASVEDLASALHVRITPENQIPLARALYAAAAEIDQDLDRTDPLPVPPPEAIAQANIALGVEAFKLPDAAFGILGFDDTGAVRAAKDTIPRYWGLLTPFKQRWGVA